MVLSPPFSRGLQGAVRLRNIGLLFWLPATAAAGLPGLLVSHRLARRRVVEALFETALRPVPLLTLLAALLGASVAFSTAVALGVVNLDALLLTALRRMITRDIAPLLVGIFVAGRSGVALTVRIRRMAMSGELDALRLMGESPARYILSPALLGFFAAATGLFLWALLMAHFCAALVLDLRHVAPISRYRDQVISALPTNALYGLIRAEVFGMLAFTVAAYEGSRAATGHDTQEESSGKTFVYSLVLIFAAEAFFAWLDA